MRGPQGRMTELLRLFTPLALSSIIISLSHTIINAGLARLSEPEIALSAFAVAKTVTFFIENPIMMIRQSIITLVDGVASYRRVRRLMHGIMLGVAIVIGGLAFTPLGPGILRRVMGVQGEVLDQVILAMRGFVLLPLVTGTRDMLQGLLVHARNTRAIPAATLIRLVVLVALMVWAARIPSLPGALVGAVAFTITIAVEALVVGRATRRRYRLAFRYASEGNMHRHAPVSRHVISRFYMPLIATSLMGTAVGPMINGNLSHAVRPEVAIAGFWVAWGLAGILFSPLLAIHQVAIGFTRDNRPSDRRILVVFALVSSVVITLVMIAVSSSPVGIWILRDLIGARSAVLDASVGAMKILAFIPLVMVWREFCWGYLMGQRRTGSIGWAKGANILLQVFLLRTGISSGLMHPSHVAALAVVLGETIEAGLLGLEVLRMVNSKALSSNLRPMAGV